MSRAWRAGAQAAFLIFCMVAGSLDASAQGAPAGGFVDRTGHGHRQATALKVQPAERPIEVPFMPGVRLNISREEVLRQEGSGHDARFRSFSGRALEPGKATFAGVKVYGSRFRYGSCPREEFKKRLVFGYEADNYSYLMNPHTGQYDMLRVTLGVRTASHPDYYKHFITTRDHLIKTLGEPDEQGFMVTRKAKAARITPKNLHAPGLKHRAYALAYWRTGGLHVKLTSMPLPPRDGLASVTQIEISTRGFDIEASKRIDTEYDHNLRPLPKR